MGVKIYFAVFILSSLQRIIIPMSIKNVFDNVTASNKILDLNPKFSTSQLYEKIKNSQSILSKRVSFYGEPCKSNSDCDLHSGLICLNSTCLCSSLQFIARLGPVKLTEGQKITECVLRAGSDCGGGVSQRELQAGDLSQRSFTAFMLTKLIKNIPFLSEEERDLFFSSINNRKCVDNAVCIAGVCQCSQDYFRDRRGLCLRKRTLLQPCTGDDNCRSSEGLQCIEGKCQCKMSMVYDTNSRKCFIPVDGSCDAYSSSTDLECVRNAECSNERCACINGYTRSSDGSCGVSYGNVCSTEKECSDIQLTCRSGRCQCRYPVHQKFNETSGLCESKPDGPCTPTEQLETLKSPFVISQSCIPFAECLRLDTQEDSMFEYSCKCIQGYDEDQVGDCVPSYLSDCIGDEDCDQVGQLTCVNGKCTCPDDMLVWDRSRRKCVGVVGARCKFIQLERILSMRIDVPTDCVENAICVEHVSVLDGRCECKNGYYFYKKLMKCVQQI